MFETMRRGGWTNIVPEPYPEDPDSLEDVQGIVSSMRGFQKLGLTRDPFFRMRMLRRLRTYLKQHEDEALDALQADLGKAPFEGYATEVFGEACRLGHSVYDVFYFVLARRLGATLFTEDRRLIELCEQNGVDCVHILDLVKEG